MENQKSYKGVIALLVVIIIILATLCILFATGTISFNTNKVNENGTNENINDNNQNNNNDNDDNTVLDFNTILEKINGVWGHGYYMISIDKSTKQYLQGQYGTDGIIFGTITDINEVSNNKYELEIFSKGCTGDNCMEEKEDEIKIISIEVDTARNIVINNNNEYQFITSDHSDNNTINAFFYK